MPGGGGLHAAHEMRKVIKRMESYMRRRQERLARRKANRQATRSHSHEDVSRRAGFPCQFLCASCHYTVRNAVGACPACGNESWIDLGEHLHADAVRDEEEFTRVEVPVAVRLIVLAVALVLPISAAILSGDVVAASIIVVVGTGLLYVLTFRRLSEFLLLHRDKPPRRWRVPVPLPPQGARPIERISGNVEPLTEPLSAPFSGRPCVACEALVLFDDLTDVHPPRWASREVDACDVVLSGRRVPGERLLVQAPPELIDEEQLERNGTSLERILRERGLFVGDGEFELHEAIVAPGDAVTAAIYGDPPTAILVRAGGAEDSEDEDDEEAAGTGFDIRSRRALSRVLARYRLPLEALRKTPLPTSAISMLGLGAGLVVLSIVCVLLAFTETAFVIPGDHSMPGWMLPAFFAAAATGFGLLLFGMRAMRDRRATTVERVEVQSRTIQPFAGSAEAGALSIPVDAEAGSLTFPDSEGGELELAKAPDERDVERE